MMKLNWFSPLPPARTDIAHYTKRVLPALTSVAEVTLWTDQSSWEPELEKLAPVKRFRVDRLPFRELNRAHMNVYQIGNNYQFHGAIWHVSRLMSGVVVLHDFRLHHFFDELYRVRLRELHSYLRVMDHYYGERGMNEGRVMFQRNAENIDEMAMKYPMTEFAMENALAAVVHTDEAFNATSALNRWPVACLPLPFPALIESKDRSDADVCRIAVFGYLGKNRRLHSVLQALAEMHQPAKYQLNVYGEILDEERSLRALIRSLKLNDRVRLHGYRPEAELDRALANSDLVINLRYPSMGEASGSQLRSWAHALPSLVSQTGWYAHIPEDAVAFVRTDEHEVNDIKNHLKRFHVDREWFRRMGERGRQLLIQNHSPERYTDLLLRFLSVAKANRIVAAEAELLTRTARKTSEWLPVDLQTETFERLATKVFSRAEVD